MDHASLITYDIAKLRRMQQSVGVKEATMAHEVRHLAGRVKHSTGEGKKTMVNGRSNRLNYDDVKRGGNGTYDCDSSFKLEASACILGTLLDCMIGMAEPEGEGAMKPCGLLDDWAGVYI